MSMTWYCGNADCSSPPLWLFALLVIGGALLLGVVARLIGSFFR